jgi:DNA-nicking Smr family endonuclease
MSKHNKYQYIPDHTIDLHGMTLDESRVAVNNALDNLSGNIRFIVGKGVHSAGGVGVIREQTKRLLAARTIPWRYAKIDQGGDGVIDTTLI